MKNCCLIVIVSAFLAAGCTTVAPQGYRIAGEHSAHFTDVWPETDPADRPRQVDVHHTFTIRNEGAAPATFVQHRYTTNTTWHFSEHRQLPITLDPGESIEVTMRGRMYKPESRRFFTELTLDDGEAVRLEMVVQP